MYSKKPLIGCNGLMEVQSDNVLDSRFQMEFGERSYIAPASSRLVVLTTDINGVTCQYVADVIGDVTDATLDGLPGVTDMTVEAWVEIDGAYGNKKWSTPRSR